MVHHSGDLRSEHNVPASWIRLLDSQERNDASFGWEEIWGNWLDRLPSVRHFLRSQCLGAMVVIDGGGVVGLLYFGTAIIPSHLSTHPVFGGLLGRIPLGENRAKTDCPPNFPATLREFYSFVYNGMSFTDDSCGIPFRASQISPISANVSAEYIFGEKPQLFDVSHTYTFASATGAGDDLCIDLSVAARHLGTSGVFYQHEFPSESPTGLDVIAGLDRLLRDSCADFILRPDAIHIGRQVFVMGEWGGAIGTITGVDVKSATTSVLFHDGSSNGNVAKVDINTLLPSNRKMFD